MKTENKILLTGASGYIGGHLLKKLEQHGYTVNCLARTPEKIHPSSPLTSIYIGDLMIRTSMWRAFRGVDTAFYLVHSLKDKDEFEDKEIRAAENFAAMARQAGVKRIIYLGALANEKEQLSKHLQSRIDTGYALRRSGITTIELRASIVIGNGSSSFELLKDLTDHLPFMITPSWVSTRTQPIGISDLLDYLEESILIPTKTHEIIPIGGSDTVSYGDLMKAYAKQRGYSRLMIPVPVLTPTLSSHWISLFSQVDPILGRRLIEGIKNATVIYNRRAERVFSVKPISTTVAIAEALKNKDERVEETTHVYAA